MQYLDNEKTKEFAELFAKKDILGLEAFNDKNPFYKELYKCIKGRIYFDEQSKFSFHISPNQKTGVFVCLINEPDPMPRSSGYNLEMHVIRADKDGKFHRSEQIRYDFYDDMNFKELQDDAIILYCDDNPRQDIRRRLKPLPKELTMNADELEKARANEAKAEKIREARRKHYQQTLGSTFVSWSKAGQEIS